MTVNVAVREAGTRRRANTLGLWLFFASETFLFAAVISSRYVVAGTDKPESLNQNLALAITAVLLLSSVSAFLAETSITHGDRRRFVWFTSATIGLGVLFLGGVVLEWSEGLAHFPPDTIYGSVFFTLIGLHALHVLTGVIALVSILFLATTKNRFGTDDSWPVEGTIKYWHFVDLAWVVIYPTLYLF
jgi:cytochrome c oxidase subunit 3